MLSLLLCMPLFIACQEGSNLKATSVDKNTHIFDLTKKNSPDGFYLGAGDPKIVFTQSASGVEIKGNALPGLSGARTSGFFLGLPTNYETQFSGSLVRVSVHAKRLGFGGMKVAYSTAEVGNSGWKIFKLTPKIEVYSFEYQVPELLNGRDDFIGILPTAGPIQITSIEVKIL